MEVHAAVAPAVSAGLRSDPPPGFLVKSIAERYAAEFALYRRYIAQQEILVPLGLSAEEFLTRQRELSHEFVRDVADKLLNHRIGAEAIIAGIDQTGPHIFKVVDPGIAISFDTPCFAAIGIGSPHAESYLMTVGLSKNMGPAETIHAVFAAKMKAEIAAGVGSTTDLFVIRGGTVNPTVAGGAFPATKSEIETLRAIFRTEIEECKVAEERAIKSVVKLLEKASEQARAPITVGGLHGVPAGPSESFANAPNEAGNDTAANSMSGSVPQDDPENLSSLSDHDVIHVADDAQGT